MRIISPVDHVAEAGALVKAGADELYGGYLPAEWQRYGLAASLNQRTFAGAQITTEQDLAGIIALVHDHGCRFSLTLNAPFYTDDQLSLLDDHVDRMVALGIDGLILADAGLLRRLRSRHATLEYHASTLAHLTNAGSVRFMVSQGIRRVVLPRHLCVSDMAAIIRDVPGVAFDAFLLIGKCPNSEGLCTFHHVSAEKIWPCEIPYEIMPVTSGASPLLTCAMRRQASWSQTNRRHGCGLCAIPHLRDAGIRGLKLVGRGAPSVQKVQNIALAREFLALAESVADFTEYRSRARLAHRRRFGAMCHPNVCYYPEFLDEGSV